MVKLSIIIVAFRNMKCLSTCLASIPDLPWIEVIVVNNSHQNRGFSAGCNMGAALATGNYLLFLNPDCVVDEVALVRLVETLEKDKTIGIVGPKLTNIQGKAYLSCNNKLSRLTAPFVYSFLNKFLGRLSFVRNYWYGNAPPTTATNVGSVCGAAMGMRKEVFNRVLGFDTRFFLYWEEFDLAIRIAHQNLRIVFDPSIVMIHEGELSTIQPRMQVMRWFRESRFYFFRKHFGLVYAALLEGWLTFSEEWRYIAALLFTAGFGFWFYSHGWWLHPAYVSYWEHGLQSGLPLISIGYWLGVGGGLFLLTMIYNELKMASRWAIFGVSVLMGVWAVLFPMVGLVILVIGLIWIVADLRKNLLWSRGSLVVLSTLLLILSSFLITWKMIKWGGFSASLSEWLRVVKVIDRSKTSISIRCVGCSSEKDIIPLVWLLSEQNVTVTSNSTEKMYLFIPPYSQSRNLLPDTLTIRAGRMAIAWPLPNL